MLITFTSSIFFEEVISAIFLTISTFLISFIFNSSFFYFVSTIITSNVINFNI